MKMDIFLSELRSTFINLPLFRRIRMSLYTFYRISKPSADRVQDDKVHPTYKTLRNRTFWGATAAYSLFYLCRLSMGVVKKPLIDDGIFSATELGVIASAFYFVYAVGKFINGFMADYCNVRRYMATGLVISSVINLLMGLVGLGYGYAGFHPYVVYLLFALLWGVNGWVLSMGSPSGIVSLSRWFPQSRRGTYYSIFCSTPYIGEALSMVLTGSIVAAFGWEYGFIASADVPDPDFCNVPDQAHGFHMAPCLQAGAHDAQNVGILPGQRLGGGCGYGGSADAGDAVCIQNGLQMAVVQIIQEYDTLVGGKASLEIVMEDGDDLGAHDAQIGVCRRHEAKDLPGSQGHCSTEHLDGFSGRVIHQGVTHQIDTAAHIQQFQHLTSVKILHTFSSHSEFVKISVFFTPKFLEKIIILV